MADLLISKAGISDKHSLLEPSTGKGKIIDRLLETYDFDKSLIDCVELNAENCNILRSKGYNTFHQDFLSFFPNKQYDRIIACPTFKGNTDLIHIQHMYSLLKNKGIMVSLISPAWCMGNDEAQVQFREWLKGKEYYMQMLPDFSFIEEYETVPTAIIKIFKKEKS